MTPQEQYEHLVETVKGYNPAAGFDQIRAAYEFADTHHAGQNRKDGSPFITHPLAVAQIVAEELHLDTESIVAALLHDTIEDTTATHEELAKLFSPTVADLVEGVSKLTRVHYTSKEEEQMENLRKMLMAMAKDIRVILIKISDRLHNMRTMEYQTPEKQKQKSFETMEIYAPIAHRLGMQKMKWELEDLSLKYLDPVGYREITEALDEKAAEYDGFMSAVHDRIVTRLKEEGIDATVYGRMKHPYSIYRKMYTQNKSLDDVFDLFAFRVIVDTVADCYNVLGIIHDLFKPILGRFKDYIGTPKPNMYQSLHTTVVGPGGKPVEIQIRTWDMHRRAEFGIAAHWKYKENGQAGRALSSPDKSDRKRGENQELSEADNLKWIQQLADWTSETPDSDEFLGSLKEDLGAAEVYVFTPKGKIVSLPAEATPIDFAYAVHTEVGHRTMGARVNGRLVPLDTKLENGDTVEILTSKSESAGPSRDWLSFAKSPKARNKIRQWFSKERRTEAVEEGRDELTRAMRKRNLPITTLLTPEALVGVADELNLANAEAVFVAIGDGQISTQNVISHLVRDAGSDEVDEEVEQEALPLKQVERTKKTTSSLGISVKGVGDIWVKLARCCMPVPGDKIIGFITRNQGVSVHRVDCQNMLELEKRQPERVVDVQWTSTKGVFMVKIQVEALDRPHLLSDVTRVLSDHGVNIISGSISTGTDRVATSQFSFEMADPQHLNTLLAAVRKIEGVFDVYRITGAKDSAEPRLRKM